jgi:hypothetical protein
LRHRGDMTMAHYRLVLLIVVLFIASLVPRPAEAQNAKCFISAGLREIPASLREIVGLRWVGDREVPVGEHTLTLRFCAPDRNSVDAERMLDLAVRALPVLQDLTDVQLDGSHFRTFYLDERDNLISLGADGYIDEADQITLHAGSRESTVVHELAHYWADRERLREPWLVEAYAEYLTSLAAPRLGVDYAAMPPWPICEQLPLIAWQPRRPGTEVCAYATGQQVLHDLAAAVGEDTLRTGYRQAKS